MVVSVFGGVISRARGFQAVLLGLVSLFPLGVLALVQGLVSAREVDATLLN